MGQMNLDQPVTTIDQLPEVLFIEELAHVLRIPVERFQQVQDSGVLEWPALPALDDRRRYSRRVLLWFLTQHPPDWEAHRRQFTKQEKALRRNRQRWYELAPPFTKPFVAAVRQGERPCLSVAEVAVILRASEAAVDQALQRDDFPLPPAQSPPPRWAREQLDRFLGPPSSLR
jgi:hypothetical protein